MNKKFISILCCVLVFLMFTGCQRTENVEESTVPTTEQTEQTEQTTSETEEMTDPNVFDSDEEGISVDETIGTEETDSTEGTDSATESTTEPTTEPTTPEDVSGSICCKYAEYLLMSPEGQEAFMNTFSDPMAFIEWLQTAEAEHAKHDSTDYIEGGDVDIGDYT